MNLLRYPFWLLAYLGVRLFSLVAQALPMPLALRLGEAAGDVAALLTPGRKRIAIENLLCAYPRMSKAGAGKMAQKVYEHLGRLGVEMALAPRLLRPSNLRRHVTFVHADRLERLISDGKGGIIVTAHLGIWEIAGPVFDYFGVNCHSVYRPVKNPLIDRHIRRQRAAFGQTLVERDGALPRLLRVLRKKGYAGLLVDQHAKRNGTWVPFFGRLASTTPGPALLALRTGAPIMLAYSRRLPGTYKFEVFFDEPFTVEGSGDTTADVERITFEISRRIEGYVRKVPEQWLWLHRRWHKPPPQAAAKWRTHVRPSGKAD